MLDPNVIRHNPNLVKNNIKNRKVDEQKADVEKWLALDEIRATILRQINEINHQRKKIAKGYRNNLEDTNQAKLLKEKEQLLRRILTEIENEWLEIASWIPNILAEDIKVGFDESDNVEIYAWTPDKGELGKEQIGSNNYSAKFMPHKVIHSDEDFEPLHHIDVLEKLKLVDMKQAAKVSGSRFCYLIGDIVKLQRSLHELMLEKLDKAGFIRMIPPLLVKEKILWGTSHFPEGKNQVYKVEEEYMEDKEPLFLVGSSEPSNFAYGYERVFDESELPLKIVAITPCFRTEVGNWGKDVRGLKRLHQFDKLEMDVICKPEQSEDIYNELLQINKEFLQTLELPFHIIEKCSGDSGYSASYRQCDVEVWLPSQKTFMEVGTNTNATDYQARRLKIKYFNKKSNTKEFVHTVNDTGVSDRMIIAIVENYQQKDGRIKVPKALVKYMQKQYIG